MNPLYQDGFLSAVFLSIALMICSLPSVSCQFKLVDPNGAQSYSGLKLLTYDDGTVCDDYFDMDDANLICRLMGKDGAIRWKSNSQHKIPMWGIQEKYTIKMDDLKCPAAGRLSMCTWTRTSSQNCEHKEDVFLQCTVPNPVESPFTLEDRYGRNYQGNELALLKYNGGTVCDDSSNKYYYDNTQMKSFDDNIANVICKAMGRPRALRWDRTRSTNWSPSQSSYSIRFNDVACPQGVDWSGCSYSTSHTCSNNHNYDVLLSCADLFTLEDSSGQNYLGNELALLKYNGGTVCEDNFDINAANAICKAMGRHGARDWSSTGASDWSSNQNSYDITLDDVACAHGADWSQCTSSTTHNCAHHEDVLLSCTDLFTLKVKDNTMWNAPALLLFNGKTVCDDYFDDAAANAVCQAIGTPGALGWSSSYSSSQTSYDISSTGVWCSLEGEGGQCTNSASYNCAHDQDVRLSCAVDDRAGIFLTNWLTERTNTHYGIVLFKYREEMFGAFSPDIDEDIANKLCVEMGYTKALNWTGVRNKGKEFNERVKYFISNSYCDSSFKHWNECTHSTTPKYASATADYSQWPVLSLICDPEPTRCPAGKGMTFKGCEQCGANTYSAADAAECIHCPNGKQSPAGSDSLADCQYGSCSRGYYRTGSGACKKCGMNSYSSGSIACTPCPDNKVCPAGSDSLSDCKKEQLRIYEYTNFRWGGKYDYVDLYYYEYNYYNLGKQLTRNWNDDIDSLKAKAGHWKICKDTWFTGTCYTICEGESISSLSSFSGTSLKNNQVSSVRLLPYAAGCPNSRTS